MKQRESNAQKRIFPKIIVDRDCDTKDVSVFEDYSVKLILQDLEFSSTSQDKYLRMQLLERNDGKKWFLWVVHGKVGRDN